MIYKNMPFWQIVLNLPLLLVGFGVKTVFFAVKGFGREYIGGIKNGFEISRKNRNKKVNFISIKVSEILIVEIELLYNIIRRLRG